MSNVEMLTSEGNTLTLLGSEMANVFLFFRPDQEYSKTALKEIAYLERELAGKSVRWVTIVSDRYSREDVQAVVEKAGLDLPILIDAGDTLRGKLRVILHPVVGITDQDHVLKVYQNFRKVNFTNILRAQILHVLGEISEAELDKTLNPPRAEESVPPRCPTTMNPSCHPV